MSVYNSPSSISYHSSSEIAKVRKIFESSYLETKKIHPRHTLLQKNCLTLQLDYEKKTDELLVELARHDELKNKKLMTSMWIILITVFVFYTSLILLSCILLEEGILLGIIICVATVFCVIVCFYALKIELEAGYYECHKCHHRFIPTYMQALISMHMSTTRYLKCPKCGKRSWARKVMSKGDNNENN